MLNAVKEENKKRQASVNLKKETYRKAKDPEDIMRPRMETVKYLPKRIFINNIDSNSSKYIAKFLCKRLVGPPVHNPDIEEEDKDKRTSRAVQVVGSVSEKSDEDSPHVLEEYFGLNREELLPKLMECDVIIYNISQNMDQVEEALWAVSALHNEMGHFSETKMFILISTVMTWAGSKPDLDNPERSFTDKMFVKRKPHPNFRQHLHLEKKVVKLGKTDRTLFLTYVVASGLQYGMGEQVLHFFFKTSWLGLEHEIPVFGDGHNTIPMIHISDLARVIQNVIEHQPKPHYLLAVDSANSTMEDIVKAIASELGSGKIKQKPFEDAFLTQELSMTDIDSMMINLHMEAVLVKALFSINWLCESGLVDNIELVAEEYRQTRGLLPLRLCVLGPPAVGKSALSKLICQRYTLHHIILKEAVSEAITKLEDTVKNSGVDSENDESPSEAQELLNNLRDSMEPNEGLSDEQMLMRVLRDKLMSPQCRNQGFVLDGLPETYEQAKELFTVKEHELEDGQSQASASSKNIIPEFVISLDATDDFLKDRVMNMPERLVQEHNYELEHFLRRLAIYRENKEDETAEDYFDELGISLVCLEITSSDEPNCSLLMQRVCDAVGEPRNYGPCSQELEEMERRKAEERMKKESQQRAKEEQREKEEARERAARWEKWGLEEAKLQEEQMEAQSAPMKSYLMEHVMPTVTQGLLECCMTQPDDPVDFLAEYLLKNNTYEY